MIATDAMISLGTGLIKISVFGLAGAVNAQVLAFALLIGAIAIPGAFLAKAFVERMPVHIHTAILDVAVITGGLVMISAAAKQLIVGNPAPTGLRAAMRIEARPGRDSVALERSAIWLPPSLEPSQITSRSASARRRGWPPTRCNGYQRAQPSAAGEPPRDVITSTVTLRPPALARYDRQRGF